MNFRQLPALLLAFGVSAQAMPAFVGVELWNGSVTGSKVYHQSSTPSGDSLVPVVIVGGGGDDDWIVETRS